jgi:hypothetical protein
MQTLKTFEQFDHTQLLSADWRPILPERLVVTKGVGGGKAITRGFSLANVIKNANMTQVMYEAEESIFGHPDEMGLDVYYYDSAGPKLAIDVIYGDLVACEFTVMHPDRVEVVEGTSYGSKFDPSDTEFTLCAETIGRLVGFINEVDGFSVTAGQLSFLGPTVSTSEA